MTKYFRFIGQYEKNKLMNYETIKPLRRLKGNTTLSGDNIYFFPYIDETQIGDYVQFMRGAVDTDYVVVIETDIKPEEGIGQYSYMGPQGDMSYEEWYDKTESILEYGLPEYNLADVRLMYIYDYKQPNEYKLILEIT